MFGTLKKAVYMNACGSFCGDEELRVPVLRVPTLPLGQRPLIALAIYPFPALLTKSLLP